MYDLNATDVGRGRARVTPSKLSVISYYSRPPSLPQILGPRYATAGCQIVAAFPSQPIEASVGC